MKPHFETLSDIRIHNFLCVIEESSAYEAAMMLLESDFHGMPVLSANGALVGKVTEMNLLRALKTDRRPLKQIRVQEIMEPPPPMVGPETSLERATEIMDAHRLLRLPVFRAGRFVGNLTRHDLLRAWLGTSLFSEKDGPAHVIG